MTFWTKLVSVFWLLRAVDCASFDYGQQGGDWTGTCQTGTRQSPIDIGAVALDPKEKILFKYGTLTEFAMDNNGHTLTVTPEEGHGIWVRTTQDDDSTKDYKLAQFHFHRRAEHLLNGSTRYEMEIHLVHTSTEPNDNSLVVVGFLVDNSDALGAHEGLQTFLDNIMTFGVPPTTDSSKSVTCTEDLTGCLDLDAAFTSSGAYGNFYNYNGSLTTPTCDERVTWFVASSPLRADLSAFLFLPQIGIRPDNYRNVQTNPSSVVLQIGSSSIPPTCAERTVLQLLHLQDFSASYTNDMTHLKAKMPALLTALENQYVVRHMALGTFVDKPLSPSGYPTDYCYREAASFSADATPFIAALNAASIRSGRDWAESQYDAIRDGLESTTLGWMTGNSTAGGTKHLLRVVMLATDAGPHTKGDQPDLPATHVDGCTYADYPSHSDVKSLLEGYNVYPLFLVTNRMYEYYNNLLTNEIGTTGKVLRLADSVIDIVDAIAEALEELCVDNARRLSAIQQI